MAGALDKLGGGSNGAPAYPAAPAQGGIIGYPGLEPPAEALAGIQRVPPGPALVPTPMPLGAAPAPRRAYWPEPAERPAHLCVACKHFMEKAVMLYDQDGTPVISPVSGLPMRERQGRCLVVVAGGSSEKYDPADLTNENVMACTHFEDRRSVVTRIASLIRKVIE